MKKRVSIFPRSDRSRLLILFGIVFLQALYYLIRRGHLGLQKDWQSVELTFNYTDFGFIKRGLLGDLFQRFARALGLSYSYGFISAVQGISLILFTLILLGCVFWFVRKTEPQLKDAAFICALFFVVLGGFSFYYLDWAEPDVYMIVLTLASAACIYKDRFLFVIPINCALCTMIHEGYPMMFFMIVMAMLFYKWLSHPEKRRNKYLATLLLSGAVTSALFVYFYFFASCKDTMTLEIAQERALRLTGVDQITNLEYTFFGGQTPINGFWANGKPTFFL